MILWLLFVWGFCQEIQCSKSLIHLLPDHLPHHIVPIQTFVFLLIDNLHLHLHHDSDAVHYLLVNLFNTFVYFC